MIEISCGFVKKINKDTIMVHFKSDYLVEYSDALELDTAYQKLAKGKRINTILDTQKVLLQFSKEALEFLSEDGPLIKKNLIKSSVFIIDNLPNRIIGRFFITIKKPKYPVKIVSTYEEAIKWISELPEKN